MDTIQLLASLLGLSFVAGVRLYATIFAIGLGVDLGLIHLAPRLSGLQILGDPMILTIAGVLYFVEFFADKIPWLDSAWDAVHTFIRPLGAAMLAATVLGDVDPTLKLGVILLCGTAAFSAHAAKAGTRLVVNHSPEPFTNIGMSLAEDTFSLLAVWLSFAHPLGMLVVIVVSLATFIWLAPKFFRVARRSALAISRWLRGGSATPKTDGAVDAIVDLDSSRRS